MRGDPPPIARLREQLVEKVRAPLSVSATSNQYYFDEDHAAYCEIEVRRGEAFIAVVVLFPNGLAGVCELIRKKAGPLWTKFRAARSSTPTAIIEPVAKGE